MSFNTEYYRDMTLRISFRPSHLCSAMVTAAVFISGQLQAAPPGFSSVRLGDGLAASVYADETHFTNATAFAIDEQGRIFIAEDGRPSATNLNVAKVPDWVEDSLGLKSVEDRASFLEARVTSDNKELPPALALDRNQNGQLDLADLETERHRIRLVEDLDDDGKADRSNLYTEGFNSFLSGRISGLLARNGALHVACVPDLWLLDDSDQDGKIDHSSPLHHGFGIHLPRDHRDMAGPVLGPDGRIYWATSDRGSRVEATDVVFEATDLGAIYRSEIDGSQLELFAIGFRNPRGLTFNDVGDLFVYDAAAPGDEARLIHVAEAGDYGWRLGWRILPNNGPWKLENLGDTKDINSSQHVLPPVVRMGGQPAGIVWHDGVGLPSRYAGRLLLAESANGGRIHSVLLKQEGASYARSDTRDFARNIVATDIQLAPDGSVLALASVGKDKTERIWRIGGAEAKDDSPSAEAADVLKRGLTRRSHKELGKFLEHPSQRVRIAAQLELVERCTRRRVRWKSLELRLGGGGALTTLSKLAKRGSTRLVRLHALWGLAHVRRLAPKNSLVDFTRLLSDRDDEVRAQMARIAGETQIPSAFPEVVSLTMDPKPRVRYFATMSLARFRNPDAVGPIMAMLRDNRDADPMLRHAGAVALASIGGPNNLLAAAHDQNRSVRIAAALAMRRLGTADITLFLNDSDTAIYREAARAIYDLPIEPAMRNLASRITQFRFPNAAARRIANACYAEGDAAAARGLIEFANSDLAPEEQRVEAFQILREWPTPSPVDRVTGQRRIVSLRRDTESAVAHLAPLLPRILFTAPTNVRITAAQAAAALKMAQAEEMFEGIVSDRAANVFLRIACLEGLAEMESPLLQKAMESALASKTSTLTEAAKAIQKQRLKTP